MSTATRQGRPPDRQDVILRELRGLIVGGELPPGSRLPNRLEIEEQYGASTNTVQRVLERLKREGFITVNGRNGTHVSHAPPHLTRYGLIFPSLPGELGWVRFWSALSNEALRLEQEEGRRLPAFHGIDTDSRSPEAESLCDEVREHRLAGLILVGAIHPANRPLDSALWNEPDLPRAVICPAPLGVQAATIHLEPFQERVAAFLKAKGRRKVAFIVPPHEAQWLAEQNAFWTANGFETRPYWWQLVHQSAPLGAHYAVQLLMQAKERPDTLVIIDDNLVEHAASGLVASGVRVPEEVEVVAHCNFPYPVATSFPVHRYGYDTREVLAACIRSIDLQRRGDPVPAPTTIPLQFESEMSSPH